jgi:hypothetical protein
VENNEASFLFLARLLVYLLAEMSLDNLDHPPKNSISHLKYLRNEKSCYASFPAQANQLEESVVLSKG